MNLVHVRRGRYTNKTLYR